MESPLILNHHALIYWYWVGVSDWYGITTQFICAANLSQLRLKTETDDWHFVSSFDQKRAWILFFVALFCAGWMPGAEYIHFKCKRCYSGCKNDASDVFHLRSNSGCNKESISCWVLSLTQGCPPWPMIWCHLSELKRKFEEEGELDSWCQLKAKLTLHMVSRRPLYTVQGYPSSKFHIKCNFFLLWLATVQKDLSATIANAIVSEKGSSKTFKEAFWGWGSLSSLCGLSTMHSRPLKRSGR